MINQKWFWTMAFFIAVALLIGYGAATWLDANQYEIAFYVMGGFASIVLSDKIELEQEMKKRLFR